MSLMAAAASLMRINNGMASAMPLFILVENKIPVKFMPGN